MGNKINIFKLILLMQLVTCAMASYGHPDAETIDFGSTSQQSRDDAIIEAAIKRGMDGDAVAELLRTKKPVVRTETTPNGYTKTTTYKLEDDGSISRKTVTQKRNRYVYNSSAIPESIPIDELRKSPTGTITRTFTDDDGYKVTQVIGLNQPKPATELDTDDLNGDWFSKPFPAWPEEKPAGPSSGTYHRTITRTFTGPNGERRTVQTWSSDPELTDPEKFFTSTFSTPSRRTSTTFQTPHVSETPQKPKFPSIGDINWPTFEESPLTHPWDGTMGSDNSDEWEIVEDNPNVESTTKKRPESWTPKTWDWPKFPIYPSSTTTIRPKLYIEPEPKPLPTLEEFLKSQYGANTNSAKTTTTTTPHTPTNIPKTISSHPSTTTVKPPIAINIDDLPVAEILHNGKPADDTILKNLPPHLTPKIQTDRVLKIEHKYPIESNSAPETNTPNYSKSHNEPKKLDPKDLDPTLLETLKRAGISPDGITDISGNTITKTRTDPAGRTITTTYKLNTAPKSSQAKPSTEHHAPPQTTTHSFSSYKPIVPPLTPLSSVTPITSPISEFLAKLGLTKFDISSNTGRYTKTIIDDNGDVLTATFVLSSPKGIPRQEVPRPKPYK